MTALRVFGYVVLVAVVIAGTVFAVRDLMPPRTLRFAAGIEGGGYWRFAERYRDILAGDGIALDLVATAGSVENARLLDARAVQAGFLQGGVSPEAPAEGLASIFIEPLLIFARSMRAGDAAPIPGNVAQWRGLTIAAGPDGSGTRAAVETLLEAAGVAPDANRLLPVGAREGAQALSGGAADIAVFVAPLSAPYLGELLSDPEVRLVDVDHAVALSRRMSQATIVEVPSGAFQLSPPLPVRDRELLALVARLAATPDLHPALVDRLIEAALQVHGGKDILSPEGAFPNQSDMSLPPQNYAGDRLADGPSPLAGFLPFWMVAQVERLAILLLPIVFLLLPLLRLLPGLYAWGIRSRVFRHYARIREIDTELTGTTDTERLARLHGELTKLDEDIAGLNLPLAYRDYAYNARLHIELLRGKIERAGG